MLFRSSLERAPETILADVREGYVSREAAERDYGVVVVESEGGLMVDGAATTHKRNKDTQ